ncbi:MAG: SirB2 family protein [Haemophilus parainfluenzae]
MLVYLHIVCAFLSLGLLIIRGGMQLSGKDWRAIKLLKILPHLVDTLLIASGLTIFFLVGYQLQSWLIMKIIMLVFYIFFSAKYFSRKTTNPNNVFLVFAVLSFLGAIFFAYQPDFMEVNYKNPSSIEDGFFVLS